MHTIRCALIVLLVAGSACATAPPSLTPAGVSDFKRTQVLDALALIRNTATAAHETTPPLLSTKTTGTIVTWHRSTILVINARPAGWEAAVLKALAELEAQLAADRPRFLPYLTLTRTIVEETLR